MTTTDPKSIDPKNLDAEERAILDQTMFHYRQQGAINPGGDSQKAYRLAWGDAESIILARRQFFAAPQPETVGTVETTADRIAADLAAGTFRGVSSKPAPCPTPEAGAASEKVPFTVVGHDGKKVPETMDGMAWAKEFCWRMRNGLFGGPIDEGMMVGWFANAIESARSQPAKPASVVFDGAARSEMISRGLNLAKKDYGDRHHNWRTAFLTGWIEAHDQSDLQASQPVEAKRGDLSIVLDAVKDAASGWRAILAQDGAQRLYGIGWDRVRIKLDAALAELKREGIEG